MKFGSWDESIHNSVDQKKRLKSAQQAEYTPIKIDLDNHCGIFSSSRGYYNVNLDGCTCGDFIRRHLPCKHMYRLAIELNLIDVTVKSNVSKINTPPPVNSLSLEDCVSQVEQLEEGQQIALKEILLQHLFHKKNSIGVFNSNDILTLIESEMLYVFEDKEELLRVFSRNELNKRISTLNINGFKKNMSLDNLIKWCIDNISEYITDICSDALTVKVNPMFDKSKRKLYTYLRRKYDTQSYFDGEKMIEYPAGSELAFSLDVNTSELKSESNYQFPNDDITELLNKFNCNRCNV